MRVEMKLNFDVRDDDKAFDNITHVPSKGESNQ